MKIYKIISKYFDKLEDKIRGKLTHLPLVYAFIGSVGIVSIWRGVWDISDDWGIEPWMSLVFGILITMITGLFVSFFIGENIIISGLNKEKRTDEKTEEEIHIERKEINNERLTLIEIQKDIKEIKEFIFKNNNFDSK
jgi:large-conductance mechanosensitive channel